jgi:hypothetical protein
MLNLEEECVSCLRLQGRCRVYSCGIWRIWRLQNHWQRGRALAYRALDSSFSGPCHFSPCLSGQPQCRHGMVKRMACFDVDEKRTEALRMPGDHSSHYLRGFTALATLFSMLCSSPARIDCAELRSNERTTSEKCSQWMSVLLILLFVGGAGGLYKSYSAALLI